MNHNEMMRHYLKIATESKVKSSPQGIEMAEHFINEFIADAIIDPFGWKTPSNADIIHEVMK